MRTDINNYKLTAPELEAIRMILKFEGTYAGGVPSASPSNIGNYFTYTLWIKNLFPSLKNDLFKGWVNQYFTLISNTDDMAKAYTVWQFFNFVNQNNIEGPPPDADPPEGYPSAFVSYWNIFIGISWGWNTPWYGSDMHVNYTSSWDLPANPTVWNTSVKTLFESWKSNPPATYISKGPSPTDQNNLLSFESNVLNNWSTFPSLVAKGMPVWASQSAMVKTMVAEATLGEDAYFFMLHLLIVAASGKEADQKMVKTVLDTITNSIEYPNDAFVNQLIYSNLMYLADPLGDYGWSNGQIQTFISELLKVIISTDAASAAIKQSLQRSQKILVSSSAYPMNDPYCPAIGFNSRKSDTLEALDTARKSMKL